MKQKSAQPFSSIFSINASYCRSTSKKFTNKTPYNTYRRPKRDYAGQLNIKRSLSSSLCSLHCLPRSSLQNTTHDKDPASVSTPDTPSIESFQVEVDMGDLGRLRIAPLKREEIGAASVVLTRAFAASPQGIPIDDCRQYCENMLNMPNSRGIFLVGRLYPPATSADSDNGNDSREPSAPAWLPRGQTSRLIATASISFDPTSRDSFQSLQPPDEDAYLCNIAVDPKFRRRGVARHLLAASESLAAISGFSRFYLHVRLGDEAARSLYESEGYREIDADSWLVKLQGRTPASLMLKEF